MTAITLLDGSMGQELVNRSPGPITPLWSTQVLIDNPNLVAEVHGDYAAAGATVATTNTYAIHRDRLRGGSNHYASDDLPNLEHLFEDLLVAGLRAVEGVRDRSRVAGSIGPLGASYRADLHPDHATSVSLYGEVVDILSPSVDILIFETVPSIAAARAALAAGRRTDRPVWLAFTVDDTDGSLLRSGEPLADAIAVARDADAVLANCSLPEVMPAALDVLSRTDRPFGAYANGFTKITQAFIDGGSTVATALSARTDLDPAAYARHALSWVDLGATIIGGCCEVGPAHIREVASELRSQGHTLV